MKILLINKFFFLGSGTERCFFDLAELLSQKGHQVLVWSTQHSENFPYPEQADFAQFIDLNKQEGFFKDLRKVWRIFWNKEAANKLERVIKREKPDIAHLHNIFSHLSPSIVYTLKKYNIPIVMTLHDYKMFCPNYKFFTQGKVCFDCLEKRNYGSCFTKKCIKNSRTKSLIGYLEGKWQKDFLEAGKQIDVFLAPSLFIKKKALAWGLPQEKVVHLSHFINKDFFSNDSIEKNSKPYFLYFGRLSQEKGINHLVESFLEISDRFPKFKLKIVGAGPEKERLINLTKDNQQIEILDTKSGRDLITIIAQSYAVIVPSVWPEVFCYSVSESLILGKPVLASRIGGIPELIKDKKTGLLFNAGNQVDLRKKIIWSIYHNKELNQMAKLAQKEILDKCDPEKHYQTLIKIYKSLV